MLIVCTHPSPNLTCGSCQRQRCSNIPDSSRDAGTAGIWKQTRTAAKARVPTGECTGYPGGAITFVCMCEHHFLSTDYRRRAGLQRFLSAIRRLCVSSASDETSKQVFFVRCCRIGSWTGCDLLLRVPSTIPACPSSPAARRGATQSPSCYCSTCSAVLATRGAVMGACCSLFSRRSAKAASLAPGKRGAVTPLGEPSLVPCSRACAALCLESEPGLSVQGTLLLCVHVGQGASFAK